MFTKANCEDGAKMSSIDEIVLLMQKQQEEVKALLLAHKQEIVALLIEMREQQ